MEADQTRRTAGPAGEQRRKSPEQHPASKQPPRISWRLWSAVSGCIGASFLCFGVCVLVFLRSSELQTRIVSVEQRLQDAQLSAWMLSPEQVEPFILARLDQILEEVGAGKHGFKTLTQFFDTVLFKSL